jgi:hypothetical protein
MPAQGPVVSGGKSEKSTVRRFRGEGSIRSCRKHRARNYTGLRPRKSENAGQCILYGLNVLRVLQLDEAWEEIMIAALKYTGGNQRNSV